MYQFTYVTVTIPLSIYLLTSFSLFLSGTERERERRLAFAEHSREEVFVQSQFLPDIRRDASTNR